MKEVIMYESEDGEKLFNSKADCACYDNFVICKICNCTGVEKYEHKTPYPSGLPDSGWVDAHVEIKTRKCTRCLGMGYVKINIEDDPEYTTYKRLQEKFKNIN